MPYDLEKMRAAAKAKAEQRTKTAASAFGGTTEAQKAAKPPAAPPELSDEEKDDERLRQIINLPEDAWERVPVGNSGKFKYQLRTPGKSTG